ncbi:MAG: hypothetical protein JXR48_17315 [Candidatus Delongbacteria bacterium]|nr:hypothetical protein [Candidatus Delongbacteria bacterium]MBN2836719.1 hypothetical protein [Candidatus Delongbacteria bacterium]
MKKILLTLIIMTNFAFSESGIKAGVVIGVPTGINFEVKIHKNNALNIVAAWNLDIKSYFETDIDYRIYGDQLFNGKPEWLNHFFGIGGRLLFSDDFEAGVHFPLGVEMVPKDVPLDVLVYIAPEIVLVSETKFGLIGGVGIRYIF